MKWDGLKVEVVEEEGVSVGDVLVEDELEEDGLEEDGLVGEWVEVQFEQAEEEVLLDVGMF